MVFFLKVSKISLVRGREPPSASLLSYDCIQRAAFNFASSSNEQMFLPVSREKAHH